jgi:hypothetical protein
MHAGGWTRVAPAAPASPTLFSRKARFMGSNKMDKVDEQILKAAKEIVVKFIETGRISPTTFPETFRTIYFAVEEMVKGPAPESPEEEDDTR